MMARLAEYIGDNGIRTGAGTANAITVTTNSAITTPPNGMTVAFKALVTNTGAVTLGLNGGTGLKLRKIFAGNTDATDLDAADVTAKGIYLAHFDASANSNAGAWILINPTNNAAMQGLVLSAINNAATKDTPVDADAVVITDSADSGKSKRVLWSRVKAVLQAFFDNRYLQLTGGVLSNGLQIIRSSAGFLGLLDLRNSGAGDVAMRMAGGGRDFTGQHIEIGQRADGDLFLWNGAGVQWRFTKGGGLFAAGDIAAGVGNWVYSGFENSSSTVRSSLRPTTVVAGNTGILFADGNLQGSKWGGGYLSDWIEARSYNRTRDYLLSEQVPIGGTAFLRLMLNTTYTNPQSVGGGDLSWSNVEATDGGRVNYGTWAPLGVSNTNGGSSSIANKTTQWKRVG
ncbi:hypothetical protein [Brucella pituitosa]|nr:hypothetical protein [Brucella pituitosa]